MPAAALSVCLQSGSVGEPDDGVAEGRAADGQLVLEERFSIVPEWVLDAEISDAAVRLYAVLLRFGATSGQRMPSRRTLAERLRKKSVDSVDRALRELVAIGAVEVTRRTKDGLNLTNRYLVRSSRHGSTPRPPRGRGGRTDAATPNDLEPAGAGAPNGRAAFEHDAGVRSSRTSAATRSRKSAARVAAPMRPDPEFLTETNPPPGPSSPPDVDQDREVRQTGSPGRGLASRRDARSARRAGLLAALGVSDLADVAARCAGLRRQRGLPSGLWSAGRLTDLLADAVLDQGLPAAAAIPALLAVAADPATRSPARVRCAGPWWDVPQPLTSACREPADDVAVLESILAEADGRRVVVQREARDQLAAEGLPLTRASVARRAVDLLSAAS